MTVLTSKNWLQSISQGLLLFAAFGLVLAAVWVRPGPRIIYGVDAGCYARVATELALRPVSSWGTPTLMGKPFYEQPATRDLVRGCFS